MREHCDEDKEKLPLYIDGTCQEADDEAFLRRIKETAKTMPGLAVTEDFRSGLRKKLEQEAAKPKQRVLPLWKQAAGFVAAAAVIAISVVTFGNLPKPDVVPQQNVAQTPAQNQTKQEADNVSLPVEAVQEIPQEAERPAGVSVSNESQETGIVPRFNYAVKAELFYTFDESAYAEAKDVLSACTLDGTAYMVPVDDVMSVCEQLEGLTGYVGHRPAPDSPEAKTEEEKELFGNFVWITIEKVD